MRLSALNRLRLAFSCIGALLLGPLGLLAHSVNERLEAQRRLRHEVVADRIFDELERELTTVLSQEFARPSSAYDAASIGAGDAVPYVLAYFTTAEGRHALLGGQKSEDERERRAAWALDEWEQRERAAAGNPARAGATTSDESAAPSRRKSVAEPGTPAAPVKPAPASPRSSPEILKKLNRSQQERSDFGY
jgi:hypothetical protein